ncbi:MAG: substrate-binding domain-containing protein, partial [Roseibacillus sp.]|nr:substrate-binding domain-containing protein [Roseibacillus sp.]
MNRTTFFLSLVLSVLFLGLVSCGDSNDTAADGSGKTNSSGSSEGTSPAQAPGNGSKGTIGMTCMNLNNPFFQLIAQEMEKAAAEAGYTLKAMDGKGDAALQNTQIDEFITQKSEAIFLNPADSKATGSGVR